MSDGSGINGGKREILVMGGMKQPAVVMTDSMSNPCSNVSSRSTSPALDSERTSFSRAEVAGTPVIPQPLIPHKGSVSLEHHHSYQSQHPQQSASAAQPSPQHCQILTQPAPQSDSINNHEEGVAAQALHRLSGSVVATISPNDSDKPVAMLTTNAEFDTNLTVPDTSIAKRPSLFDVVLADNTEYWHNSTFAELVASHAESFSLAPLSTQALIVQAIATRIEKQNGRFLEHHGRAWRQITGQPLFLGIARALFHQVQLSQNTSSPNTAAAPGSNTYSSSSPTPPSTNFSSSATFNNSAQITDATLPPFHYSISTEPPTDTKLVLNTYLDPMWSDETMSKKAKPADPSSSNASTVSETSGTASSSRVAKVTLPMAARTACVSARTKSSPESASKKANVVKKTKHVKKPAGSSSATVRAKKSVTGSGKTPTHDGLHTGNRASPVGFDMPQARPDSFPPSALVKRMPSPGILARQEEAAAFDPENWIAQYGTLEAMNQRAQEILPTLNVEVIPRGVTVRPSGKWQAQFYFDGQSRYIGVFDGSQPAALAYECVHRLLASFRKLSRLQKSFNKVLSKEATAKIFANAREAAVKGVSAIQQSESP